MTKTPHVHKTTYGPLIYTAQYVMVLMKASPLRGPFEGVGPEFETFLGHEMANSEASAILPKKVENSGPTPSNGPSYGLARIQTVTYWAV